METISLIYNVIFQGALITSVIVLSFNYAKKNNLSALVVFFVSVSHYLLTIITSFITNGARSDANNYFIFTLKSNSWFSEFGLSTTFIRFLIYPFIHYLKLNYFSVSLIFGSFGLIGFILLYKILDELNDSKNLKFLGFSVILIILFLPSYHIWMSSLGKDSLVFMLTMILLNGHINRKFSIYNYITLVLLLTFIRPYIGVYLFMSFIVVYLFQGIKSTKKLLIIIFFAILGLVLSFQIFDYLKIDISSFFSEKIKWYSRYSNSKKEGSFVDPLELNTIQKVFTYLYRPFFYDAKGIGQIIVSFENLFFIFLFLKFIFVFNYKIFKKSFNLKLFMLYCTIFVLVNSFLIYNIGLVNRQKYMLLPLFLYAFFYFNNQKSKQQILKKS